MSREFTKQKNHGTVNKCWYTIFCTQRYNPSLFLSFEVKEIKHLNQIDVNKVIKKVFQTKGTIKMNLWNCQADHALHLAVLNLF